MSSVVLTHVLAALVALVIGIGLGWLLRGAVKEDLTQPGKKRWLRRIGFSEVLGVVVATVSTAALISLMVTISEQRNVTECQRNFNELTRQAILERAKAGDLDREVLKLSAASTVAMLDVVMQPTNSQEARVTAIQMWRTQQSAVSQKLDEAAKIRQENPLPDSPRC